MRPFSGSHLHARGGGKQLHMWMRKVAIMHAIELPLAQLLTSNPFNHKKRKKKKNPFLAPFAPQNGSLSASSSLLVYKAWYSVSTSLTTSDERRHKNTIHEFRHLQKVNTNLKSWVIQPCLTKFSFCQYIPSNSCQREGLYSRNKTVLCQRTHWSNLEQALDKTRWISKP